MVGWAADTAWPLGFQVAEPNSVVYQEGATWGGDQVLLDRAGTYFVALQLTWAATATAASPFANVQISGAIALERQLASTSGLVSLSISGLIRAVEGDNLSVGARRHATLPSLLIAAGSFLHIIRQGPERWT